MKISIHPFIHPPIHPSIHTTIQPYVYLSFHLFLSPFAHLFIHPSMHRHIHGHIHPFVSLCMHTCIHTTYIRGWMDGGFAGRTGIDKLIYLCRWYIWLVIMSGLQVARLLSLFTHGRTKRSVQVGCTIWHRVLLMASDENSKDYFSDRSIRPAALMGRLHDACHALSYP